MEKILSINSGSSSLKFKLFAMPDEKVLAKGLFDRIGIDNSRVTIKYDGKKYDEQRELKDHNQAVHVLLSLFKELKLINDVIFDFNNAKDFYKCIIYYISGMTDKFAIEIYNDIIGF